MFDQYELLIINILGCVLTCLNLGYSLYTAVKRQQKAYLGDAAAAKRIILPCFKPLMKGFLVCYGIAAILLSFMFLEPEDFSMRKLNQYFGFMMISLFSIIPVLLTHKSISWKSFYMTFYTVSPWWIVCTLLWCLTFLSDRDAALAFSIVYIIFSTLFPIFFALLVLTKFISSRIQIGSRSNRNATELFLIYALIYGITYLTSLIQGNTQYYTDLVLTILSFIINQLFPYAVYRTLLADTKFWRGMGKHNQGGIHVHDDLRNSGIEVHRPTMELTMINSSFQTMMADIDDIAVDFAYLQLEQLIGQGATSKVFRGKLKGKLAAIKLSTPPEITEEVIDVFVSEAKVASELQHKNIVAFLGICVRPPQICMIFEFCDGGNLKSNLSHNALRWTSILRLQACIDATRAIVYLHEHNFIHRDIKAENFFVGKKNIIKLGDFGEATYVRNEESTKESRMTILGTVAYMAPELIRGERYYTQAIDIYALGITFWEIWTGKDPWEDCTTFDIYERVKHGERPRVPADAPEGFLELLEDTWEENEMKRPTAKEVLIKLEHILRQKRSRGGNNNHNSNNYSNGVSIDSTSTGGSGGGIGGLEEEGMTGVIGDVAIAIRPKSEFENDKDEEEDPVTHSSFLDHFVSNPLFGRKGSILFSKRSSAIPNTPSTTTPSSSSDISTTGSSVDTVSSAVSSSLLLDTMTITTTIPSSPSTTAVPAVAAIDVTNNERDIGTSRASSPITTSTTATTPAIISPLTSQPP